MLHNFRIGILLLGFVLTIPSFADSCNTLSFPTILPDEFSSSLDDLLVIQEAGSIENASSGPAYSNLTFETGVVGKAVVVEETDTLNFATNERINGLKGTVSFWFKPEWDGNAIGHTRMLFDASPFRVFIFKGSTKNYFAFRYDDLQGNQREVSTSSFEPVGGGDGTQGIVSAWKAGEWHHIEVSWDLTQPGGQQYLEYTIDTSDTKRLNNTWFGIQPLPCEFSLSAKNSSQSPEGSFDELKISHDLPFLSNVSLAFLVPFENDASVTNSGGTIVGALAYSTAVIGNGAEITAGNTVIFPSLNNIDKLKGTISFNFKPNWNGSENIAARYFLDTGTFRVFVWRSGAGKSYFVFRFDDAAGNQREISTSSLEPIGGGDGTEGVVSAWQAGEWHRIEAFWDLTGATGEQYIGFVIDGIPYTPKLSTWEGVQDLGSNFTLGSHLSGSSVVDGVIDEFKVYDESVFDITDPINSYTRITEGDGVWQPHETIHNSPQDAAQLSPAIEASKDYLWYQKTTFEPVYEGTVPLESELSEQLVFELAQGELETLFVDLYSRVDSGDVSVSMTVPVNGNGVELSESKIYLVKNWWQAGVTQHKSLFPVYTPELLISNDISGDGAILSDLSAIKVEDWSATNLPSFPYTNTVQTSFDNFTSRQFALVVNAPEGSEGAYLSTIELRDAQGSIITSAEITINVSSFALVKTAKNFLTYHRALLPAQSSNAPVTVTRYTAQVEDIIDHGLTGLFTYGTDVASQRTKLEIIANTGWDGRIISTLGSGSSGEQIRDLVAEFGYEPWFYGTDEPNSDERIVKQINKSYKIHSLGDELGEMPGKVITAIRKEWADKLEDPNDPIYMLEGINAEVIPPEPLDFANLSMSVPSINYIQGLIDGTSTHSVYPQSYYWQSLQENPSFNRSLTGFYLWNTGLDGVFPYVYQDVRNNPYNDFDDWSSTTKSYRDHLTTYPSVEGPIRTIQWEAFREGIDDHRYLETWQLHRDIIAQYDADFAMSSTALVETKLQVFSQFSELRALSADDFFQARELIRTEIIKLINRNNLDDDGDGLNNGLEISIGTDVFLVDTDGDTISDFDEANYDGDPGYTVGIDLNPLAVDSDSDGYNDDVEITIGSNPLDDTSHPADGDINNDGVVNVADLILASQIVLGLKTPTASELSHGDVAPLMAGVPTPDGEFNVADLLIIQKKVLGLISF